MKFLMKLLRENYSMGRGMHTAQKNRPAKPDGKVHKQKGCNFRGAGRITPSGMSMKKLCDFK